MYHFRTKPFSHQARVFEQSRDLPGFAVLWEQGTGKTKLGIDTAAALYLAGKIDAVVIVAPNGVHRNWVTDEVPVHCPEAVLAKSKMFAWNSDKAGNVSAKAEREALLRHDGLAWLMFSYNGFVTKLGKEFAKRFLLKRRCLFMLDEAHNIKEPGAKRTKTFMAASKYAPFRRILTGTPVAQGPFDVYSQLKFIDNEVWVKELNISTFQVFKQHFGVWFTAEEHKRLHGYDPGFDKLIEYQNIEQLNAILLKYGSRVLKDEVLDLPPKLYSKRYVELTPEQKRIYADLKRDFVAEVSGKIIEAPLAIVRLLRFQQTVCGYIQDAPGEPILRIEGGNPRLNLLREITEDLGHQAIVWARFSEDIDQIMEALGNRAVRYDGRLTEDEAARSKEAFQRGDAQFFVANPAKGATGLTLNMAKTVVFYSNSFKLIDRLQAEDRCHRIGQNNSVEYIDLIAEKTVDEHIVNSLRTKLDVASAITGDQLKEWL